MPSPITKVNIYDYKNRYLIIHPYKPQTLSKNWYPSDGIRLLSKIHYTRKNLGVTQEAIRMMQYCSRSYNHLYDLDWSRGESGNYSFSWFGSHYRIFDLAEDIVSKKFNPWFDRCIIIENKIMDKISPFIDKALKSPDPHTWYKNV